jgi:hypothetical protein
MSAEHHPWQMADHKPGGGDKAKANNHSLLILACRGFVCTAVRTQVLFVWSARKVEGRQDIANCSLIPVWPALGTEIVGTGFGFDTFR